MTQNQPNQLDREHRCRRIGNRQSAIGNRQSAIGNRQSAIGNRQSAIGNRQSAIGNRQYPLLCLIFCAALFTSGSQNATAKTSHSAIPAVAQAGIQTQNQPRHSRAEGAGIQHSRESAPALAGAKAGIQTPNSSFPRRFATLRQNDGVSFASFYKQRQIELFSALDNALSQKAEETLTEFAAVKNAEVQLQTSLGNRQGQLGINLIGAFAESQNLGIGWQVRAFGGQNDTKGMNAGIFYRRVQNDLLYGINAFADYEDGDNGSFLRYSIGGELQNRYGALVASYYTPITGDKHTGEQVAFSREGYDFNLRLNIPRLDFLNARVDYYHYHGKYNVKEDKGLRYGAEAHLFPGLRVALLYDDDGDELGGDISYTHTIGEVQQAQTTNAQWTPDLFAAVSREHSQRIVSVNVAPSAPSFVYSNRSIVRPATLIVGSVNIPAGYAPSSVPLTF